MKSLIQKFLKDESGASLIEYVLIAALVSVASVAAMRATNTSVGGVWTAIQTALDGSH